MSVANLLTAKQQPTTKKQVLQQSNYNFDATPEKGDNPKGYGLKTRGIDMTAQETENQFSPRSKTSEKTEVKSDEAKKLRNIRFEISSLKRGPASLTRSNSLARKPDSEFSSDDSGEEDFKKKRKIRPVVPNYVTNSDNGPCRKPRQSRQDSNNLSSQDSSRLAKTQPLSIARRNARERNRVKQVNEGFATLRNRIPDYISDAYNEEKGRKTAKKLSKVETLRMAVDYIRHLETLLDLRSVETDGWLKEVKTESQQPWETPNSFGDYPSPVESKFQSSPPPAGYYDQNFEYQDRIFYDYDLEFLAKKDNLQADTIGPPPESASVDDFKFYESFDRLKRDENTESGPDENLDEGSRDSHNLQLSEPEPEEDCLSPAKPKDVINKVQKKTVLPSITESFNKGIPVFF